jgi:AcrR family transcriptional regulator
MTHKYDHLREKAISLRRQRQMTLDEIVERLRLPRTTIYYWIKDIPIPYTKKQSAAQRKGTESMQAKYAAIRQTAYQRGLAEAPELLKDPLFRDFVVLYMAEGYKRNRNMVSIGNSDPQIVQLSHKWISNFASNKVEFRLQRHIDQDEDELKGFWATLLDISCGMIKIIRKSNSGKLSGRQFRSVYGVLEVRVSDTQFRARLEGWMDSVKSQW